MHRLEKKLGYSLKFSKIPNTWINGWMTFSMGRSWRKQGIKAKGVNYFTMGSLSNGTSSRYIRNNKQYQSWLGAYLVKSNGDKELTLQDYYNLAIADQKNWLKDFGDPHPYIWMPGKNTFNKKHINIGKYQGNLYEFLGGPAHSDVGSRSRNKRNKILMALMASMFNRCNPKLKLKGNNFLPKKLSPNYERITLKGYMAIVDLEKNLKVVLYGNGSMIRNGEKEVDYYPLLKKDISNAFCSVIITKL